MDAIADYLGAYLYIRKTELRIDLQICSLGAAGCLVNFFDRYPLESTKHAQFLLFKEFVEAAQTYHPILGMKKRTLGNGNQVD
jgi:LAGLIDADG endonuclease